MIRYIIAIICIGIFLIVTLPYLGLEWILGKFDKKASDLRQLRIVQAMFKYLLWISGTKVIVKGEENVPKDEAVLYIGNHRSLFDIIITYARCPGLTGYIAKNNLEKVPSLSLWMKRLYCLFLDRDDLKQGLKTILTGIEYVKSGVSMCIFPEGTRNKGASGVLPFKEGSFKIAEKTGCAIIPMALTNTDDIFENHFPKIVPTTVVLEYGKPIYPKDLEKEERKKIGAYCQQQVEEMLSRNQNS